MQHAIQAFIRLFRPTPHCACGEVAVATWLAGEPICTPCAVRRLGELQAVQPAAPAPVRRRKRAALFGVVLVLALLATCPIDDAPYTGQDASRANTEHTQLRFLPDGRTCYDLHRYDSAGNRTVIECGGVAP